MEKCGKSDVMPIVIVKAWFIFNCLISVIKDHILAKQITFVKEQTIISCCRHDTGTGKFDRHVHRCSNNKGIPLIILICSNCENLLDYKNKFHSLNLDTIHWNSLIWLHLKNFQKFSTILDKCFLYDTCINCIDELENV